MNTRPPIAYTVTSSRDLVQAYPPSCKQMVYLLQYVRDTVAKGMRFCGSAVDMHVFTDVDWAGNI